MATLPPVQRLVTEDFADQKKWIGKLLLPLNDFMESVYRALNQGLTVKENLAADVRTVEVDGTYPLKLSWSLKSKPVAVVVGNVARSDGTALSLVDAVGVRWSYNQQSQLQIDQVVGITPSASTKYKLTLVSITG
jgi:hypothetical protein